MSNTESFESAMDEARALMADCDIPLLDRLQAAHDREVAQSLKDTYAYGYADGRRSMDAEHEHVALRLRSLRFDGGSHENLSKVAYAVYPCATGWTCESCAGLRDRLIDLLGGVRNFTEIAETINLGDESDGEPMESGENHKMATITDEPTLSDLWGVWKDDDGTCPNENGTCPNDDPTSSITDELRKYVAEIWDGSMYVNRVPMELRAIADRIDAQERKLRKQRDGFKRGLCAAQDLLEKRTDERDELQMQVDAMGRRADQSHESSHMRQENEIRITDELREFVGTFSKRFSISVAEVNAIADRIDEQFGRICDQQEAVLQSTIDEMVDERDALETKLHQLVRVLGDAGIQAMWVNDERDCIIETSAFTEPFRVDYRAVTSKCDAMQKRLDEMREQREHWASEATKMYRLFFSHDEYCVPNDPSEMVAAAVRQLQEKCSALQAKLDSIRDAIDG